MKFIKNILFFGALVALSVSCGDEDVNPGTVGGNPGSGGGNTNTTPEVSIQGLDIEEGDDNTNAFIRIRLDQDAVDQVTIHVSTIDGTAQGGVDYRPINEMPIVFAQGEKNKDILVSILGDNLDEGAENFSISIVRTEGTVEIGNETAIITILDDDRVPPVLDIPTSGATSPESYPDMNLVWRDEFNASAISLDNWTFEIGRGNNGWGNQELQFYQRENASIIDGNLVIEARENSVGNTYTSSRMITENKFDFNHGRVDIRAALPKGQGIWPALWMLGSNFRQVGWPACGEIDIMELLGHEPNKVHGTAHWDQGGHTFQGGDTSKPTGDFNQEFHVFSIIWDETTIRWLIDDEQYYIQSISAPSKSELVNNNFFFIFNVAVGGLWPGNPDATTKFPQRMIVDYIRVFQDS